MGFVFLDFGFFKVFSFDFLQLGVFSDYLHKGGKLTTHGWFVGHEQGKAQLVVMAHDVDLIELVV
jgi:hypothetical protein